MATATQATATTVEATVTSKGQVTLPRALRKHLGIQRGSRIRFSIPSSGAVKVEPVLYDLDIAVGGWGIRSIACFGRAVVGASWQMGQGQGSGRNRGPSPDRRRDSRVGGRCLEIRATSDLSSLSLQIISPLRRILSPGIAEARAARTSEPRRRRSLTAHKLFAWRILRITPLVGRIWRARYNLTLFL
jgi:AbrB family looped-hinge helix DNA binding protein